MNPPQTPQTLSPESGLVSAPIATALKSLLTLDKHAQIRWDGCRVELTRAAVPADSDSPRAVGLRLALRGTRVPDAVAALRRLVGAVSCETVDTKSPETAGAAPDNNALSADSRQAA